MMSDVWESDPVLSSSGSASQLGQVRSGQLEPAVFGRRVARGAPPRPALPRPVAWVSTARRPGRRASTEPRAYTLCGVHETAGSAGRSTIPSNTSRLTMFTLDEKSPQAVLAAFLGRPGLPPPPS